MRVYMTSPRTGVQNSRDIDVTPEQWRKWRHGTNIQNVMPNLSPEDREFLMTGYTPEDWAAIFPSETTGQTA